jgi:hypothetical protein
VEKSFSQIPKGLYDLQGTWEMHMDGTVTYEQWKINPDSSLSGIDFTFNSKGDTIYLEHLEIMQMDSSIYYIAKVMDQNDQKPIYYQIIEWTRNVFAFENKKHDFPQKITYYLKTYDLYTVIIEGPDKDKIRYIEFKFTKKI